MEQSGIEGGGVTDISKTVITISHRLQEAFTNQSESSYPWNICRAPPKLRRLHEHGFHPTMVAIGPLHCNEPHLMPMEAHKLRFLVRLLNKMNLPHPDVQNQNGKDMAVVEEIVSKHQLSDDQNGKGKGKGKAVVEEIVSKQQLSDDQNGKGKGKAVVEEIVSKQQLSDDQNGASCSSSTNDKEKKIEYLAVAVKALEANARACYSETFNLSSSEFVMMMIIDSCFVVELLHLYAKLGSEKVPDPIFNTRWLVQSLKHDLIMLENQLPLPVLEKIFEMTSLEDDPFTLTDLTLKFFNSLLPREKAFSSFMCVVSVDTTPNHLLGLFRSSFQVPKPPPPPVRSINIGNESNDQLIILGFFLTLSCLIIKFAIQIFKSIKMYCFQTDHSEQQPTPPWVHEPKLLIHCVTELKEAGISFKKRENCELLDIEFKNGELYIPPLLIDDYTGLMFLNFVAYEQCNPSTEPYFTTYLLFWDSLLNSSKDVEHLHSKGIIDHVLGSDEDVAQLFNMLCREVVHDHGDCYLSKVLEDVNKYFGVRRHRWRAKLEHDYFSNPWAFISLIAAVVLLLLTAVQAFFAVFSYVNPPS